MNWIKSFDRKNLTTYLILIILLIINEFVLVKFDPSPPLSDASLFLIRFLDIILLCLVLFLRFKNTHNAVIKSSSIFLTFFVLMLFVAEFFVQNLYLSSFERDKELGWALSKNFKNDSIKKRADNSSYKVSFSTNNFGLREFGNNKNYKFKILVLGDSFTGGEYASNDQMWYSEMAKELELLINLPDEFFFIEAGGAGGYGTYQNLLLAKKLKNKIKNPDLFILQFCSNDFSNNTYEMETGSLIRNQNMVRPYYDIESDETIYRNGFMAKLYRSKLGSSQIFQRIDSVITNIQFKKKFQKESEILNKSEMGTQLKTNGNSFLYFLDEKKRLSLIKKSLITTEKIFFILKDHFDNIPVLVVNCSGADGYLNYHWVDISTKVGFIPITNPSNFLKGKYEIVAEDYFFTDDYEKEKILKLFNSDGSHLSDHGNREYGKILANEIFKNKDLLDKISTKVNQDK